MGRKEVTAGARSSRVSWDRARSKRAAALEEAGALRGKEEGAGQGQGRGGHPSTMAGGLAERGSV